MALTFETQVEALTGIAIDGSSDPTQTELTAFLVDGVKDVVNRMIEAKPQELSKFTATSSETDAVVKTGKILSVVREHDSTSILRKCTQIDPSDRYEATDVDSLLYRSKTSPGYYELDGLIRTVPAAASGNNDIVVTQVFYDTGVAYGDTVGSGIDNFPAEYEYLVGIYAAIKAIGAKMGAIRNSLSSFSITVVPPVIPTTSASLPTYEASNTAIPSGGGTIDDEIGQMLTYIETDEDVELVVSRLQIIDRQLQEYQAATQNAVNRFQKENAIYQADLQVKIQEAQLSNTVDGNKLQKYSVDIQRYSQTIQSLVSKNQAIVNEWQVEWNVKIQKYSSEISAEINRYQADISLQSQITQSKVANYNAQIARASSEHQAQLNKYQAESGAYNAEIQKYQVESANEMQIHAKKIADVQSQLAQIQQLYLSSFTAKGAQ